MSCEESAIFFANLACILKTIPLCFYHIVKVKNKKYIFGAFIFKVIEAAQRRQVGQKFDILGLKE